MELSARQEQILEIVRREGPITGEQIAEQLNLTRATLRPDLAILTMTGILDARPRVGYFYVGKHTGEIFGEKLRSLRVGEFKAMPVIVQETETLYNATVTLFTEDTGTLAVVDQELCLTGVVSRKDLLKLIIGKTDPNLMPVSLAMTRMPNVITTTVEESVYDAAYKLMVNQVDSLPVVRPHPHIDGKLEVVGRFSKTTITRIFVELGTNREI